MLAVGGRAGCRMQGFSLVPSTLLLQTGLPAYHCLSGFLNLMQTNTLTVPSGATSTINRLLQFSTEVNVAKIFQHYLIDCPDIFSILNVPS